MLTKCSAKWAEGPRATHFVSMTYEISKSRFGEPGLDRTRRLTARLPALRPRPIGSCRPIWGFLAPTRTLGLWHPKPRWASAYLYRDFNDTRKWLARNLDNIKSNRDDAALLGYARDRGDTARIDVWSWSTRWRGELPYTAATGFVSSTSESLAYQFLTLLHEVLDADPSSISQSILLGGIKCISKYCASLSENQSSGVLSDLCPAPFCFTRKQHAVGNLIAGVVSILHHHSPGFLIHHVDLPQLRSKGFHVIHLR